MTSDPARAFALANQGCNGGDDDSCRDADQDYAQGKGVTKDTAKAAEFHKRACDGNVTQSCLELGALYESGGQGVGKNVILAEMLYRRALIPFNSPWSLADLPAASVPCGFVGGLPVGMALVGRPRGEETVLRAAHAYQGVTDWHERRPPA